MSSRFVLSAQLSIQPPSTQAVQGVINSVNRQLSAIKAPQVLNGNNVRQQAAVANRALQSTAQAANKLGQSVKKTNGFLGDLSNRFKRRFIDATVFSAANAAIVGVISAFQSSIRSAVAFERELIKVSQVTGKTVGELQSLVTTITDVSTAFGTSSSELISVSRTLAQAGLSAYETEKALKAIAATDLAPTFENMGKTAEGAIAIFGQFGTGVQDLEDQLGSINAIAGSFAVESGDLIEAIKRGGSAFQTAGGNLEEYLSLFTAVRSTTREGAAQIATGLRTIFTRIQRPQTIQYFKDLGVELTDTTGKFIGGYEAIRRLSAEFGKLEQGDTKLIEVAQQLGGVRQVTRVLPLLQQFSKAEDALAVAADGTNSVLEDREKALGTFSVQINQLTQTFAEFGRTLLDEAKVLQGLVSTLTSVVSAATSATSAIASLDTVLGKGTASFAGLGLAIGVAANGLLGLSPALSGVLGVATLLTPVLENLFLKGADDAKIFNEQMVKVGLSIGGIALAVKSLGGFAALSNISGGGLFKNPFSGQNAANKTFAAAGGNVGLSAQARGVGERGVDALGGAAVGVASAAVFQTVIGNTRQAIQNFNTALEEGTAAEQGAAKAQLSVAQDLDNAGLAISGGVGAVVGALYGPLAGQLAGAATGLVTSFLATSEDIQDIAAATRNAFSFLTSGIIRNTAHIQNVSKAYAESQQVIESTNKSIKAFDEYLKKERADENNRGNNSIATDRLPEEYKSIVKIQDRLKKQENEIKNGRSRSELSLDEEAALEANKEAQKAQQGRLDNVLKAVAEEAIRSGKTINELYRDIGQDLYNDIVSSGNYAQFQDDFKELETIIGGQLLSEFQIALQKRVDLERESASSLRDLLKAQDEAAKIIEEFGGAAYSVAQQEANIVARANAGASQSGVDNINNLSAASLRSRAGQIGTDLAATRSQLQLTGGEGEEGKALEAREKELVRLAKQNYDITKQVIDIRKKELDIIKAKNQKEQEALSAAIGGDFSKLFQQQQASGVIASAATGGGVGGFGQSAISAAISDLQAQQQAGVTSVFGQEITSLIKTIAGGGLANLGINNPNAAGIVAGATPEENALRANIRELATVLPESAKAEKLAADTQLEAARKQLIAANAAADQANVDVSGVQARAGGGSIWRNRGSDTVPAMLTPGEFVVRKSAVQRGNNLNMLRAMNGGGDAKSIGGTVYASGGGLNTASGTGLDFSSVSKAATAMQSAAKAMSTMVEKLGQLSLNVTLAPTTHNVNITGTAALQALGEKIEDRIITAVGEKLVNFKATEGGRLEEQTAQSSLPSFT